ncbi:MAG: hypothetical protein R2744_02275 [Bacteroidales bacterium]
MAIDLGDFLIVSASYLILFLFLLNFRQVMESFQEDTVYSYTYSFIRGCHEGYNKGTRTECIPDTVAIVPIVVRTFYDSRLALFILLVTLMITGFLVPNSFEFVFLNFIGGVIVIFTLTNTYRRGKLFYSATMVFLAMSVVYFGIAVIRRGISILSTISILHGLQVTQR